jgi:hypothetical protein
MSISAVASSPAPRRGSRPARALSVALAVLALTASGLAAAQATATSKDVPIPEKTPPPVGKEGAPTVTIRTTEDGDVIEEYRTAGKVTMVHVTPKVGVPYYLYDDDHNGRLDRSDAEKGDVKPVYYTIYEWD